MSPRAEFFFPMYGCTARSCGYPYTSSPGFRYHPYTSLPGSRYHPYTSKKSSPAAHYNTPMPIHIYAERSQEFGQICDCSAHSNNITQTEKNCMCGFLVHTDCSLILFWASFADYKMVQCTGLFKQFACGAKTPRLLHECSPVCSGIEKCMFVYHEHHLLHPTCTIIDITWPPI